MLTYIPHTVWVNIEPPTIWRAPVSRRVYKQGSLSGIAQSILTYLSTHNGSRLTVVQDELGIKSAYRQIVNLEQDGLITVTTHKNTAGKPFKRLWIK